MRLFEQPDDTPVGAAILGTEQFTIGAFRTQTCAVGNYEPRVTPVRAMMDDACRQFLAGTVWPTDQNPARRRGNAFDGSTRILDGGRHADEFRIAITTHLLAQFGVLAFEPADFQSPLDHEKESVFLEWFLDKVESAVANGLDRGFDGAMPGNHQHRQFRIDPLCPLEQFKAVHIGITHPDVKDGEARRFRRKNVAGLLSGRRLDGRIAFITQGRADQGADIPLVINDEDITCRHHGVFSDSSCCGRLMTTRAPPVCASCRSSVPPWSWMILLTIASPKPVPLSRFVT